MNLRVFSLIHLQSAPRKSLTQTQSTRSDADRMSLAGLPMLAALPKKWYGGKRQTNTGSAGARARYERKARNSYSVKKFEIERAASSGGRGRARAPALPVLSGSFQIGS